MLSRTLFILFLLFPLLSFSQKEINLDDLELSDVEIPTLKELEPLERDRIEKDYNSSIEIVSQGRGGIHEAIPKAQYPKQKGLFRDEIQWDENILPSKTESYYFYFDVGFGNISYTGSLAPTTSSALNIDAFGVYWPKFNQNLMVGAILGVTLNELLIENTKAMTYQPSLSLSMNYFLGKNIGSGVFTRLDLGFASVAYLKDESDAYILDYDVGWSILIGTGYALPLTKESRLLFNISYILKIQTFNNSDNGSGLGLFSAGILF